MRDYGSFIDDLLPDQAVIIDDVRTDARTSGHAEDFGALRVCALVNTPIVERGRLSAIFCAVSSVPRA